MGVLRAAAAVGLLECCARRARGKASGRLRIHQGVQSGGHLEAVVFLLMSSGGNEREACLLRTIGDSRRSVRGSHDKRQEER